MQRIVLVVFIVALMTIAAPAAQQVEPSGLRLIAVRTEAEAMDLSRRLQAGESFEELARKHSVHGSASAGGYLGSIAVDQLRREFQEALKDLPPGQVSSIARVDRDYVLLQLLTDEENRAVALKAWLDAGADVNSPAVDRLWVTAVTTNQPEMMKVLLEAGADVNAPFDDGSTVLMGAAQGGNIEFVQALLSAGANVNARAKNGSTALLEAAYAGHTDIVRILLGAAADVKPTLADGSTILMKAAQGGHNEIVNALLAAGAAVNEKAGNGLTALMQAAYAGRIETVPVLLNAGADVNAKLDNGSTALMAASLAGHGEIVRALLNSRAAVNAKTETGATALMEAAYGGHIDAVRILLAAGAEVNASGGNGLTALMGAALGGHVDIVRALMDAGADVSARDSKGWTALTHAEASASTATVQALLGRADISPRERAIFMGRTYVNEYYSSDEVGLLQRAMAEFQKVLDTDPQNLAALEWMGAVEVLQLDKDLTLPNFVRVNSLLKKSVILAPKEPERHYWIAASNWMFISRGQGTSAAEYLAILDEGIEHARKVVELDPLDADAMAYLNVLYRKKAERAASAAERDQLLKDADAAYQGALRLRTARGDRPSRPTDQFSRPALPAPPPLAR